MFLGRLTVIAAGSMSLAAHAQTVSSDFETGLDGWTSFQNGSFAPVWISPSGSDDGYAQLTDSTTGWGYFRAPAAFTAQAAQLGGTFSFDLRHEFQGDPVAYKVRVAIIGGGLNLINESVLPTTSWVNYSFPLDASSGWRVFANISQNYSNAAPLATQAQMELALGGISDLFIAADYTPSYAPSDLDRTSIDNVILTVVPAPGAASLLALGGLVATRRRR